MIADSLGEIRGVLTEVCDQLDTARRHARMARALLTDAEARLAALGEQHPEPLVPPQLRRAGAELDRGLDLISGGAALVADIGARL